MPVKVNPSETEEQFIGRCIGIEIGYGKSQEQATAICYSYWENRNMKKTSTDRVIAKINKKPHISVEAQIGKFDCGLFYKN